MVYSGSTFVHTRHGMYLAKSTVTLTTSNTPLTGEDPLHAYAKYSRAYSNTVLVNITDFLVYIPSIALAVAYAQCQAITSSWRTFHTASKK